MSEAEILSIRNDLTAIVISVVSVSFGMISAYIAGLWLFFAKRRCRFACSRSSCCRAGLRSWAR